MERQRNNEHEALSELFDFMVDAGRKAVRARKDDLLLASAVSLGKYFRTQTEAVQERVIEEKLKSMRQRGEGGKFADKEGIVVVRFVLPKADKELRDSQK